MRSNPVSPFLMPGMALAAAGAVAFAPAVVTPVTPVTKAPATVYVVAEQIALTGIGQDIYYAITPVVQEAVGGVSYLVNFVPLIGGPIAAQININYFQGLQPVVEATVNYLAAVVQDPLNFLGATADYGSTLYDIGYNWVSAEAVFFGLPPLPPLPQTPTAGRSAPRTTGTPARPDRENARTAASTARPAAAKHAKHAKPVRAAAAAASQAPPGAEKARATPRATRGAAS